MKSIILIGISLLSLFSLSAEVKDAQLINQSWSFQYYGNLTEADELKIINKVTQKSLDDSSWRYLDLPHDWAIEMNFDKKLPNRTPVGLSGLLITTSRVLERAFET